MIEETQSNWQCVADRLKQSIPVCFLKETENLFFANPFYLLYRLSYYKFAAKLIGKNRFVLDVDCHEGIGTYVLSQECKGAWGITQETKELEIARKNFISPHVRFSFSDEIASETFDAITYFSPPTLFPSLAKLPLHRLNHHGLLFLGVPFNQNQTPGFICELKNTFSYFFSFSTYGELIQPMDPEDNSAYALYVGCQKK